MSDHGIYLILNHAFFSKENWAENCLHYAARCETKTACMLHRTTLLYRGKADLRKLAAIGLPIFLAKVQVRIRFILCLGALM